MESRSLRLSGQEPDRTALGQVQVLGILSLAAPGERWFGGISGVVAEGDRITAVNDAGHWLSFRLHSDDVGRPLSTSELTIAPLGGLDGTGADGDAEEVTATPDGLVVSFERRHRLLLYPRGLSALPLRLAAPADFGRLPNNGGAEAVVGLADGRLLAIAEDELGHQSPAWLGKDGEWRRLTYVREGHFKPTAAAALPDGGVLVLERRFTILGGVSSRLVRIPPGQLQGERLEGQEVFRLEPPLTVDNYEGMAVRRGPDGRLQAILISDDNFSILQATLLMVVALE